MQDKVEILNRQLRLLVTDQNIEHWTKAENKLDYCLSLLPRNRFNAVETSILTSTLSSILQKKAEDRFTIYNVGDPVFIRKNGLRLPGKVVDKPSECSLLVLPHDTECQDKALKFSRNKEHFYSRLDGTLFSRICPMYKDGKPLTLSI